ncbi:unannotated protein [freshwater metagenome]|uniref:Unannotated protein n=1 Tax=freshwater metagenome TaxID=449393 RepID=A0A6J6AG18_9ZZZZ
MAATKCCDQFGTDADIHSRARSALCIVSRVVNVLDEMTNKVDSGFAPRNASSRSAASTFETNLTSGPLPNARSAFTTIAGPRSLPPIPILMTVANCCFVDPQSAPLRMSSANFCARTNCPNACFTNDDEAAELRKAMCPTERCSVMLRTSPFVIFFIDP